MVSPAASTTPLNETRKFRAFPRDRSRRRVIEDLAFAWELIEGEGTLARDTNQEVAYQAAGVPGLARLRVAVTQREVTVTAEALITVTDSLESVIAPAVVNTRGLPGYTFERAAGELWRCRFDTERNIIVVNSGHRDFVFATRNRVLQLRCGSIARAHDRAVLICGREVEVRLMGTHWCIHLPDFLAENGTIAACSCFCFVPLAMTTGGSVAGRALSGITASSAR